MRRMPACHDLTATPLPLQIIDGHLSGFDNDVARMSAKLVDATIELHRQVGNSFWRAKTCARRPLGAGTR